MSLPRLILVGGFLGAGKTTLLLAAAKRLAAQGVRVGLITNDQGAGLVDTALVDDHAIPVTEVAGGCFCCRFPDLLQALHRLQEAVGPEVILAEPVGSCTDLTATVLRPLAFYYEQQFILAPLTVVVGADRSLADFSGRVAYLYERQTAEAELLLLNKCDLLATDAQHMRSQQLAASFPAAKVLMISARHEAGLDPWLEMVMTQTSHLSSHLAIDYQQYAEAEAELGWCNARGALVASSPVSLAQWTESLVQGLAAEFQEHALAVAHLKIHVTSGRHSAKAGITASHTPLSWDIYPGDVQATGLQVLLNARVAADPKQLEQVVRRQLARCAHIYAAQCQITQMECFRPAPPKPSYRIAYAPNEE